MSLQLEAVTGQTLFTKVLGTLNACVYVYENA